MDITVYTFLHVLGILLVFQAIGASVALSGREDKTPWRRASMIGHGLGMLIIFVAGFGLLARLELFDGFPAWVWVKLAVWLALGALPFVLRRSPSAAGLAWGGALVLGIIAATMGIFKPF